MIVQKVDKIRKSKKLSVTFENLIRNLQGDWKSCTEKGFRLKSIRFKVFSAPVVWEKGLQAAEMHQA